jgi:hypothetical protein
VRIAGVYPAIFFITITMANYDSIMATLSAVDNNLSFFVRSEAEIIELFRKNLPDNDEKLEGFGLAEFYAFMAIENYCGTGTWNSYFGSPGAQQMDGTFVEKIPLEKITPEIIAYWKKRVNDSRHPVLKARYAGLVWELELQVCGRKPNFNELAVPYMENLLATVTNENITSFSGRRIKLARVLNLAVRTKNEALRKAAIDAVFRFQNTTAEDTRAATWRASFDLLIVPGIVKVGGSQYSIIMNTLEHWFDKAVNGAEGGIDLSAAEAVFEPLFNQYLKGKNDTSLQSVLERFQNCIDKKIVLSSAAEGMHWLEKMKKYYRKANDQVKLQAVLVRLQDAGPRLISEMKKVGSEQTFDKDSVDHFVEGVFALPLQRIFFVLPASFILDSEKVMNEKKQNGIHISDIVSTSTYTGDGRKLATIGSIDDDVKGRMIREMQTQITLSTIFLHFVFTVGRERNILTADAFMDFVKKSTVISADRYSILHRAFDAWINKDYLVFLHLTIPQIEAACLQIVKNADSPIQKENRNGGYNVLVLGDLLRESSLLNALGQHGVDYYTAVFSDPRGFNLRNEVAHGLRDSEGFDEGAANVTLIALLHLVASTVNGVNNENRTLINSANSKSVVEK